MLGSDSRALKPVSVLNEITEHFPCNVGGIKMNEGGRVWPKTQSS